LNSTVVSVAVETFPSAERLLGESMMARIFPCAAQNPKDYNI
jgi:hypothetical protein